MELVAYFLKAPEIFQKFQRKYEAVERVVKEFGHSNLNEFPSLLQDSIASVRIQ
jgi:hypothetical protein